MIRRKQEPPHPGGDEPDPHELVRRYEATLAERREQSLKSADDVERARAQAALILESARELARAEGEREADAIVQAARHQADAVVAEGRRAASALTETALTRRADDVRWILDRVLPRAR